MSEAKYRIKKTTRFERDIRRLIKQGKDMTLLDAVVTDISCGKTLDAKYNDHPLTSNWRGFRDCHIAPDRPSQTRV
jgi:mRNA interferase YafQ